jgi:GNAT superfamily N-acetyltransferase
VTGEIIHAGPADLDILSQVIADAFHPLAPSRWLVGDPAERRRIFPGYFRLYVEHALAVGVVHTIADRSAVALWLPAGDGAAQPAGYAERLADMTSPWTSRFTAFDAVLEARHPVGPAHEHLALLAVRPDRQGQGTGTALLAARHQALDRDGVPAYLEASDLRTRRIYLRHGYVDHGPPVELPDGPVLCPMWRKASAQAAPGQPDEAQAGDAATRPAPAGITSARLSRDDALVSWQLAGCCAGSLVGRLPIRRGVLPAWRPGTAAAD